MAYNLTVGSSDYIERLSTPVALEPLSMACWFNKDEVTTTQVLLTVGDSGGTSRWQLQASGATAGDPLGAFSVTSSGTSAGASTNGILAGTWHHGAAVFATTASRTVYLDGTAVGNSSIRAVTGANNIGIGMGYLAAARTGFFGGKIAEVALWNIALVADDVTQLRKGFSPRLVRPEGLVFYAPLIRDLVDLRGAPLTASGTTVADHPRIIG